MFKKLLEELSSIEGQQVPIEINLDKNGYLDKECPATYCLFQFKIKEHCYITNHITGKSAYVGNVCIDTGTLFDGLRRIAKDPQANANLDVIRHELKLGFIYESEHKFLVETRLKRKLSPKELAWKRKINHRITQQIVVRNRTRTQLLAQALDATRRP